MLEGNVPFPEELIHCKVSIERKFRLRPDSGIETNGL
jgi:hypothetical protein